MVNVSVTGSQKIRSPMSIASKLIVIPPPLPETSLIALTFLYRQGNFLRVDNHFGERNRQSFVLQPLAVLLPTPVALFPLQTVIVLYNNYVLAGDKLGAYFVHLCIVTKIIKCLNQAFILNFCV